MKRTRVSLYLDSGVYNIIMRAKKKNKSMSSLIEDILRSYLFDNYVLSTDTAKNHHTELIKKISILEKKLEEESSKQKHLMLLLAQKNGLEFTDEECKKFY